jgi:hypothetical protein
MGWLDKLVGVGLDLIGIGGKSKAPKAPQIPPELVNLYRQQLGQYSQYQPGVLQGQFSQTSYGGADPLQTRRFQSENNFLTSQADREAGRGLASYQRGLQQRGILSPGTYAGGAGAINAAKGGWLAQQRHRLANEAWDRQEMDDQRFAAMLQGLGASGGALAGTAAGLDMSRFQAQQAVNQQAADDQARSLATLIYLLSRGRQGGSGGSQPLLSNGGGWTGAAPGPSTQDLWKLNFGG